MEFNHDNVRQAVEEDRLSSLPNVLIHKILSCFDMKFAVQTCLLSTRWLLVWKSMTCLNFSSRQFDLLSTFAKFVNHVLSHRNRRIEVYSVKLEFGGGANEAIVRKIANYIYTHNVQELTVIKSSSRYKPSSTYPNEYSQCLFSSQSLKHLTLTSNGVQLFTTTKPPLDFPALTTLNLSYITLWSDIFSKCVNLKNLTLKHFSVVGPGEVFDIITPRLSNLILSHSEYVKVINVTAPQLENITILHCLIKYLNAPPELSSFCYTAFSSFKDLLQFSNDRLHSLQKVTLSLSNYSTKLYKEEDARKIMNMLQTLHSARYLTLNADTLECISSFPDLLSHHPSPFSNLICLTIDYSMRKKDAYQVTMSSEAINLLLKNSASASLIMKLPKVPK